jgi:hypothetical protein
MNIKANCLCKENILKCWVLSYEFILYLLFGTSRNSVCNMTDCHNSFTTTQCHSSLQSILWQHSHFHSDYLSQWFGIGLLFIISKQERPLKSTDSYSLVIPTSTENIGHRRKKLGTGGWRKLNNKKLHNLYHLSLTIRVMKSRNILRMAETRNVYNISAGKSEGKRKLGSHRCRWEDNSLLKWIFGN